MFISRRIALFLPICLLAIIATPIVFVGAFIFLMLEACMGRVCYRGTTLAPPIATCLCLTYGLFWVFIWSLVTPTGIALEFLHHGKIPSFDMNGLITDFP